jgi:quinolinate synthase
VHEQFSLERILDLKKQYPDAKIIAHPECNKPILIVADYIGSTSALLKYALSDKAKTFIVVTESGIIHQMRKANPEKNYIAGPPKDSTCGCSDCIYMKLNTMEKLYNCMLYEQPEILVDMDLVRKAQSSINRMLEISEKMGL